MPTEYFYDAGCIDGKEVYRSAHGTSAGPSVATTLDAYDYDGTSRPVLSDDVAGTTTQSGQSADDDPSSRPGSGVAAN